MPLLGVVGERRLIAATVEGAGANRLPRFPYLSNIEKMAIPDWPARTADISEIATVQHGATLRWAARGRPPPESTCESPILSPPPAVLSFPRNSASLRAFTPVFDDGGRN
jgi:hypothetical protein